MHNARKNAFRLRHNCSQAHSGYGTTTVRHSGNAAQLRGKPPDQQHAYSHALARVLAASMQRESTCGFVPVHNITNRGAAQAPSHTVAHAVQHAQQQWQHMRMLNGVQALDDYMPFHTHHIVPTEPNRRS